MADRGGSETDGSETDGSEMDGSETDGSEMGGSEMDGSAMDGNDLFDAVAFVVAVGATPEASLLDISICNLLAVLDVKKRGKRTATR